MTRDEHLMVIAMEECGEVSQRFSKALRFGMEQVEPGQPDTNRERILWEFAHLCAALDMLGLSYIPDPTALEAKRLKVERFLTFSGACGTLSDATRSEGAGIGDHCACGKFLIPADAACVVTHDRESHTRPKCYPGEAAYQRKAAISSPKDPRDGQ